MLFVVNIFCGEADSGFLEEESRKAAEGALSLSPPDDRTEEEQAEAGLPWIKHTPCEPSHATTLTPWGHAVTSLSSDACLIAEGRMEMEGANSGYC